MQYWIISRLLKQYLWKIMIKLSEFILIVWQIPNTSCLSYYKFLCLLAECHPWKVPTRITVLMKVLLHSQEPSVFASFALCQVSRELETHAETVNRVFKRTWNLAAIKVLDSAWLTWHLVCTDACKPKYLICKNTS